MMMTPALHCSKISFCSFCRGFLIFSFFFFFGCSWVYSSSSCPAIFFFLFLLILSRVWACVCLGAFLFVWYFERFFIFWHLPTCPIFQFSAYAQNCVETPLRYFYPLQQSFIIPRLAKHSLNARFSSSKSKLVFFWNEYPALTVEGLQTVQRQRQLSLSEPTSKHCCRRRISMCSSMSRYLCRKSATILTF